MKTIATIATLALSIGLATASLNAQSASDEVSVNQASANALVASLPGLSAEDRKAAVEAAIAANPSASDEIVAALIARFPSEAALMTETVVQAVIALPGLDTAAKGAVLTEVAIQAVKAAEFIPVTSVDNLISTINGVKNALAQVGSTYDVFVSRYTVPYAKLSDLVFNQGVLINQNVQGQTIVSDDTVAK